jgi:hypothetical protein
MTSPTYIAHESGSSAGNSTTRSITLPENVADDYIFVALCDDAAGQAFTVPSGWTRLYDTLDVHNTTSATFLVIYKKSGGNEGASITITTSKSERAVWIAFSIRGVHQSSPIDAQGTNTHDNDDEGLLPAITTVTNDALVLGVIGTDTITTPHNKGVGYTRLAQIGVKSAGSLSVWYQTKATAGAVAETEIDLDDDEQWIGVSWALKPLPPGAVLATPAVASVPLTLPARTRDFTLAANRNALTVAARTISFTLQER